MHRNLLVAMLALGLVVVGARVVIAGTATGRTPVDCIDTIWRSSTIRGAGRLRAWKEASMRRNCSWGCWRSAWWSSEHVA